MAGEKILIVEDEFISAELLKKILQKLAYQVIARFSTGEEAVEKAIQLSPDLILMDIHLAGNLTGIDAAQHIRSKTDIPILYLTSNVDDMAVEVLKNTEPYAYLLKPVNSVQLHANIEIALYRHRTENILRESEARFRAMFENMNDGVAVYKAINNGEDFVFLDFNHAAENIDKISRKELLGQSVTKIFPSIKDFGLFTVLQRVWATGNPEHFPTTLYQDQRIKGWRENYVHKLPSGELVVIYSDETLRKQTEIDKENLQMRLRQSQKMLAIGTLAGGIAHDFNNLLFPIIGYTEMSMDSLSDNPKVKSNLEQVLKASLRAKDLVQQILTFSRQGEQEFRPLALQTVIKEALKLLQATMPVSIEIQANLDRDCKPINGDPTQIHQVIINLASNAKDAMAEKGGILRINLEQMNLGTNDIPGYPGITPGTYLKLTIADTGHGMSRKVLERLFEPYFTTKEVGKGTGLGLSLVHGIVKGHKGYITVTSELGQGTTFTIYFPVLCGPVSIPEETFLGKNIFSGHERVMLVDDEESVLEPMAEMLKSLGYQVLPVNDARQALVMFQGQAGAYDLVITDATMPNMSGVVLARLILQVRPDIPIILCTGFNEAVTKEKMMEVGVRDFLMKPVLKIDLAKALRRVLERK